MKLLKFIAAVVALSGCVAIPDDPFANPPPMPSTPGRPDVVMVGDSNCDPRFYGGGASWVLAGISGDCFGGRPLMDVSALPSAGVSLVFVALGVNDSSPARGITPTAYGEHLTALISATDAEVYCVLPVRRPLDSVAPYRAEMVARCANVIDPIALGIEISPWDDVHYTKNDQRIVARALAAVAELYP